MNFIMRAMENWKVELTSGEQTLARVKIKRGIFQRDSLLPLVFIIVMMLLNYVLRECAEGYKFTKSQMINLLMSVDNIKIFAKSEKEQA